MGKGNHGEASTDTPGESRGSFIVFASSIMSLISLATL